VNNMKVMMFDDAVKAIQNDGKAAFTINFAESMGRVYAAMCLLTIDSKGRPRIETHEFPVDTFPIEIKVRAVSNKRRLAFLFGQRAFVVADEAPKSVHAAFFQVLDLSLVKKNIDELIERYNKSPLFYKYVLPSVKRNGFRSSKKRRK